MGCEGVLLGQQVCWSSDPSLKGRVPAKMAHFPTCKVKISPEFLPCWSEMCEGVAGWSWWSLHFYTATISSQG